MDKNQIVNIIKSNPELSYDEMKKQALGSGITAELFEIAWSEVNENTNGKNVINESIQTDLQKQNVIAMFLLSLITFGIYIPIWYFKKRERLNSLNSKLKIGKKVIFIILTLQIIGIAMILGSFLNLSEDLMVKFNSLDGYQTWLNFFIGLAILKASFDTRSILRDHFNTQLSGVGTFFLTIFYLQHKINHLVGSEKSVTVSLSEN